MEQQTKEYQAVEIDVNFSRPTIRVSAPKERAESFDDFRI